MANPFPMDIPPDLEPLYTNLVRISHSPAELSFDFARLLPGENRAQVRSRLIMSPVGAKLFLRALNENLARYEAAFGEIPMPGDPGLAEEFFRQVKPPDKPSSTD